MKIFIVDDEEMSIFLTKRMLSLEGVKEEVYSFLSAEEAFASIANGQQEDWPAVVLLDLNMPVMDGWQFLDAVESLGESFREKCRIYILTSSLDLSDVARVVSYPVVAGYIHKPINEADVDKIKSRGKKVQ